MIAPMTKAEGVDTDFAASPKASFIIGPNSSM